MAQLPADITTTVQDLQRRLLAIIDRASATSFVMLGLYGETEATAFVFDQLQNAQERAQTYYSRFYTLLLRIAESQPAATTAMLDLLARSIEEADATVAAAEATIQEAKRDWNLP